MSLQDEITSSVNPGDDFYNYVNKKWCDTNPIPADKARVSALIDIGETVTEQLRELLEKPVGQNESINSRLAKKLYASAMDDAAIEKQGLGPIQPFVDEIERLKTADDIKALITNFHSEGKALVWQLTMDVDEKDSRRYVMTINQGGLLLPNRDYYFESGERFETTRSAYKEFLTRFFELLGKDDIDARVKNVYEIEEKLAAASNTSIENRDTEALYNPLSFDMLMDEFAGIDWAQYRKQTGVDVLHELIIHQPKFMHEVIRLIDAVGIEAWQDYLIAHVTVPAMPFLSKQYDEAHFAFFGKVLTGAEKREDRYKRAIRSVTHLLPEPVGQLYTDAHFDENAKAAITDLVSHVQEALRVRIKQLDWMSETTKERALEKLDTFAPLLGYPDKWHDYSSLELVDGYVENVLTIRTYDWKYDIGRVTGPVDREEWLMSPATVNAYYWPNTNGITFPAAILQPPAFDAGGDFAANYGAIGVIIGHEIIHGFDDNGSKYDKIGNFESWWTDEDRTLFEARAEALAAQYDAYEIDGHHVKGQLTLGENIADLGGILIAYDALQNKLKESDLSYELDGFTPEQRFFLAQARIWRTNIRPELALQFLVSDPHSPAHLRVNGVVTNVDAWYDNFDIAASSVLYKAAAERIRIW